MIVSRVGGPRSVASLGPTACSSLLVVVLLTLVPLADASPVDPTWIPGLYDNGDGDDIVLLVADRDAPPIPIASFMAPSRTIVPVVLEPSTPAGHRRGRPASERAPPAV